MISPTEQLSAGGIALRLAAVLALVLANAFFVAAEFALVGARRSQIDHLAEEGDRRARTVQQTLTHLDRYISATQLGITLASLALGWIGESTVAELIARAAEHVGVTPSPAVSQGAAIVTIAFLIITFLHIVLGELVPKSVALLSPEGVSRWVAAPLRAFATVMTPLIALLTGAANALLHLLGLRAVGDRVRVHSPEELRLLVMQTHAHGLLDEADSQMLAGVFDFHHKRARDVMRPRTEIVALPVTADERQVWEAIRREGYSRYPVYGESLDDLVGVFLAKDLWLHTGTEPFSLARFVRQPLYVPDTRRAERVLEDLRRTRAHMAIVLDEYGGTAGIVTLEDLVEEVVGDIADEYDVAAREVLETNGVLELAGSLSLIDVRSDHHIQIPEGSWTTLGGYVFSELGRLARVGDRVAYPGGALEVVAMDGRRVAAVRVHRLTTAGATGAAGR